MTTKTYLKLLRRPLVGPRACDDRGSVSVIAAAIITVAVAFATLLVDAGTTFRAEDRADTLSSEAARAAVIAVGPVPVGDGMAALRAQAGAESYLRSAGVSDFHTEVVGPASVRVTVTVVETSPILHVTVSESSTHTAQLQVGVTKGQGVG